MSTDLHAVFATLDVAPLGGTIRVRVTDFLPWAEAVAIQHAAETQRIEETDKGHLVTWGYAGEEYRPVRHYEVRAMTDPGYASAPFLLPGFRVLSRPYATHEAAAKAVLAPLGYTGHPGGYIRHTGRVIGQGWVHVAGFVGHPVVRLIGERKYRAVVTSSLLVRHEVPA